MIQNLNYVLEAHCDCFLLNIHARPDISALKEQIIQHLTIKFLPTIAFWILKHVKWFDLEDLLKPWNWTGVFFKSQNYDKCNRQTSSFEVNYVNKETFIIGWRDAVKRFA